MNTMITVQCVPGLGSSTTGLGSSTVDQVLKYTKYPKYIPSTSTGQVLIFLKSTSVHQVLSYQVQVQVQVLILKFVLKSGWTYRAE